ncbi:MAG: biotin/lipoyl-containing protein [Candidatus Krumholzibacteriia bacterium]
MKLKITVHGVAYEVDVEVLDAKDEMSAGSPLPSVAPVATAGPAAPPQAGGLPAGAAPAAPSAAGDAGGVASPIAGTVLEVRCKPGQNVTAGQGLVVIEAMKMETVIAAPGAGTVKTVLVAAGDSVRENQILVQFA